MTFSTGTRQCDKHSTLAVAIAVALLMAWSSRAGTITVGNLPAVGTDAATGLNSASNYLCCLDFGNGPAVGSIRGVPFTHVTLPSALTASGADTTFGGVYTLTANHNLGNTSGGPVTAGSQADGQSATLLTDLSYVTASAPAGSWLVQDYGGLSAGAEYALRFYYRQWSATGTRALTLAFNGEGTNQAYAANPLNEDVGGAHYLEYDFTASSGDVFVYMTNLNDNESALLYGMSLQQTASAGPNTNPSISQVLLPATGTDAATGIGTGSNYLCVLSFGASAFSGSLNGIAFTPVNLTGLTQSGADLNYGGTWTASTTDANGFKDVAGGGASVSAQADGIMAAVLAGASYLGVAPVAASATLNFGWLAPGERYLLRYYYRQWDAGDSPPRPVRFIFNGDGTNAVFQTDQDLGGAYYLEYDFTAASNTVSLTLVDASDSVNYGPMMYAITLQSASPVSLAPHMLTQPAGGTNAPGTSFRFSVDRRRPAPAGLPMV